MRGSAYVICVLFNGELPKPTTELKVWQRKLTVIADTSTPQYLCARMSAENAPDDSHDGGRHSNRPRSRSPRRRDWDRRRGRSPDGNRSRSRSPGRRRGRGRSYSPRRRRSRSWSRSRSRSPRVSFRSTINRKCVCNRWCPHFSYVRRRDSLSSESKARPPSFRSHS